MEASRRRLLPMGGGLSDEVFAHRHLTLRILLALHVPGLALLGYFYGQSTSSVLGAVSPIVVFAIASRFGRRTTRALILAVGLAYCSAATVGLANGSVEAHFHPLVMIGFVALYQDWVPLVGLVSLVTAGYLVAADVAPTRLFDAPTNQRAALWAAVHIGFVLAESLAMVVFWRATENEQNRATSLARSLTQTELERTREQSGMRESSSGLLENLARRNQALLDRQLERIDALEKVEKDPEALAELFSLDHLATRMRRNAESLLVLAGSAESRGWTIPIPLSEICRGAMAEVEDYARVDVALITEVMIDGNAVGDLVHLVAELIENATSFSPPTARVLVSGNVTSAGYVIAVSDAGIGMADVDLHAANLTLAGRDSENIEAGGMLGLHVIARLAERYDMRVWLQRGQDIGLSAMIAVPQVLIQAGGELPPAPIEAPATPAALEAVLPPVEPAPVPLLPQQTAPLGADHEPGTTASPFVPAPVEEPAEPLHPARAVVPEQPVAVPVASHAVVPEQPLAELPVAAYPVVPEQPITSPQVTAVAPAPEPAPMPASMPSPMTAPAPVAAPLTAAPLTAAGLQRRVPLASLAAPLSQAADTTPTQPADAPIAPERARSVLSAYVGGANRARQSAFSNAFTSDAFTAQAEPAASEETYAASGDQE